MLLLLINWGIFVLSASVCISSTCVGGKGGRCKASLRLVRDDGIVYAVPLVRILLRKFHEKSGIDFSVTATFFKARITSATFTP
jgi:hypothetical protein